MTFDDAVKAAREARSLCVPLGAKTRSDPLGLRTGMVVVQAFRIKRRTVQAIAYPRKGPFGNAQTVWYVDGKRCGAGTARSMVS